jgi:hypothetical protein
MGTRNLTMVINHEGETKIAQYGQWDGYPSGQGVKILEFLQNPELIERLKSNLSKVRFYEAGGRDKDFINEYQNNAPRWSNDPDNRTPQQKLWFERYISRDIAAEILVNIANSPDDEIIIDDSSSFGRDEISCEWAYVIDFQKNELRVHNDLPHNPIAIFALDSLPSEEEFLSILKTNEED